MIDQFINFVIRPPRAEYNPEQYLWEKDFTLAGRKFRRQDLELRNGRGHTLRCSHYMPSPFPDDTSLPCVIYCHGNSGCRADANEAAVILLPSNITVFTLDFSGSGLSDGDYVSLGWHESDDLKVVVSYLRSNEQISRIGLWGRSMGAVTSLLYGAEDPSIAGMVLDSAFSNLFNLMMELVDVYKIRLPKFTVKVALQYMRRVIQKKAKFDIMDINALKVAPKTFIPALFGHAKGDKFIQPHHSDLISNSYAGDKNTIKFDGDHNSSRPQFYYDSVSIFFHNVLHPPRASPACSSKYDKYYDLGDLQVDAGIEESLFYEIIAGQPLGIDAASTSSAPPSILTTGSVGDYLPGIVPVDRNSLVNDVNSDSVHDPSQLQDKPSGQTEECCSYTSSNRESWGRCSSLGSDDADCTTSNDNDLVTLKVLATPLRTAQHALADVAMEKKKVPKRSGRGRLPAFSFASAACVSRSWNLVCDRVLCRPKLSSAYSFSSSLQVAVEDVLNKALSEPIRPHFAIASIGPSFDLHLAHQLITEKLGSKVPVITNFPSGIIGRDAISDEFKEIQWEITEEDDDPDDRLHPSESANRAIMLIVGFLPGIKVKAIPLLKQIEEPQVVMIDKFVMDIREYSTSISRCRSPAAIIMFSDFEACMKSVMEKMDYAMSPDTVIVGDTGCQFLHSNESLRNTPTMEEHISSAVALVFAVDKDRPGMGETQFNAILSTGLSPVGPTYKAASVREKPGDSLTWLTARREGFRENIDGETILNQVYDELGDRIQFPTFYVGVTKRRKCSIGQDKVGWMTSLAFHEVLGDNQEYLFVGDVGIKTGDSFRFYHSDSSTALSSNANVSDHLRCFKQGNTTGGDKKEVFGGLVFTCCGRGESFFGQTNVDSSPFLDNFPGVTLAGTFCGGEIGRGDLNPYNKESQEQRSVRCCLHVYSSVYLVMSYTSSKGN